MLWVRLPPLLWKLLMVQHAPAGHWRAQVAVTHPRKRCAGSTPARRTNTSGFYWPGGGTVDAMVSKAVVFGREGSIPSLATVGVFRGRLMAGWRALTPLVLVRPQPPEL